MTMLVVDSKPLSQPVAIGSHPSAMISFEHSIIVYLIGIAISIATAVMIKLISLTLRNLRPQVQE